MSNVNDTTLCQMLLNQKATSWEALQQWTSDLNKLLYWLGLLFGGVTVAYINNKPLILSVLAFGFPLWLHTYLRSTYWYGVNMIVLGSMESYLNDSLRANKVLPGPLNKSGLFVQATAGQPSGDGLNHPFRAPVAAALMSLGGLAYVLLIGWRSGLMEDHPGQCWTIWGLAVALLVAACLWFKLTRVQLLRQLAGKLQPDIQVATVEPTKGRT